MKVSVKYLSKSGRQLMALTYHRLLSAWQIMYVNTLKKGIYLVKIQTNTGIETKKLVIQ